MKPTNQISISEESLNHGLRDLHLGTPIAHQIARSTVNVTKESEVNRVLRPSLIPLILAAGLGLFSACLRDSDNLGQKKKVIPAATVEQDKTAEQEHFDGTTLDGTSTSGGGNGVDNRIYESYIKDPSALPEFKKYIAPIFAHLGEDPEEVYPDIEKGFEFKTWYIAPVDLKKIDKNTLGVSFLESGTQQIARQTMKEIWIDQRVYDKMNLEERAHLLMHEFVMSLFLIKHVSLYDLCVAGAAEDPDPEVVGCKEIPEYLENAFAPEPMKPLGEDDYAVIRSVTAWLFAQDPKTLTPEKLTAYLYNQGFDKRFFGSNAQDERYPESVEMDAQDLIQVLRTADLTGFLPDQCNGVVTNESHPCDVELKFSNRETQHGSVPEVQINVRVNGEIIASPTFALFFTEMEAISATTSEQPMYMVQLTQYIKGAQVGDKVQGGDFIFRYALNSEEPVLSSILLIQGVITKVDQDGETARCKAKRSRTTSFRDDIVHIGEEASVTSAWIQTFAEHSNPIVLCEP